MISTDWAPRPHHSTPNLSPNCLASNSQEQEYSGTQGMTKLCGSGYHNLSYLPVIVNPPRNINSTEEREPGFLHKCPRLLTSYLVALTECVILPRGPPTLSRPRTKDIKSVSLSQNTQLCPTTGEAGFTQCQFSAACTHRTAAHRPQLSMGRSTI